MNAIQAAAAVTFVQLRFGDPVQIAAVRLLEEVEGLKEAARKGRAVVCPSCDGKTYTTAADCGCEECEQCEGDWMEACGLCDELGLLNGDGEPLQAAWEVSADARASVVLWMRSGGQVAEWLRTAAKGRLSNA